MNIITGYTGAAHVTANAVQGFNQGIFGSGNYVLNVGEEFAATVTDSTTITIADGEGIMQGVHFRIEPGTTEDVTLTAGTSGYYRKDLICARYTKDSSTGVEDVSLVVVEGTATTGTPSIPSYNSGNILDGESPVDFPLYLVYLEGINAPTLTTYFTLEGKDYFYDTATLTGTLTEGTTSLSQSGIQLTGGTGTYLCSISGYITVTATGDITDSTTFDIDLANIAGSSYRIVRTTLMGDGGNQARYISVSNILYVDGDNSSDLFYLRTPVLSIYTSADLVGSSVTVNLTAQAIKIK